MDWSATWRGLAAGVAVLLVLLVFAVLLTGDLATAFVTVGRYSPIAMLVGGAVAGASEARAQRGARKERTPAGEGVSSETGLSTEGDTSGLVVGAVLGAIPAGIVGLGLVLAAQARGTVSLAGLLLAVVIVVGAVSVSALIGGAGDAVYRTLGGRLGL